jgi:hypothetical protein
MVDTFRAGLKSKLAASQPLQAEYTATRRGTGLIRPTIAHTAKEASVWIAGDSVGSHRVGSKMFRAVRKRPTDVRPGSLRRFLYGCDASG